MCDACKPAMELFEQEQQIQRKGSFTKGILHREEKHLQMFLIVMFNILHFVCF